MLVEVMLVVAIKNSQGKIEIYQEPMPSVEVCTQESLRFLTQEFPEFVNAKEVYARCTGKIPAEVEVKGGATNNPD